MHFFTVRTSIIVYIMNIKYFNFYIFSCDLHRIANYADLSIGIGMHDILNSNEGYIAAIDAIILHEDFHSDFLHDTNDIALIRLQHPVKIDENVKPACLPHKGLVFVDF